MPSRPFVCTLRAHPRSRGENTVTVSAGSSLRGSSPLTRGKPSDLITLTQAPRLIPAHAGKTDDVRVERSSVRAHPRSRGEN